MLKRELCRAFAFLPIFCQNEALGASADVGVSGADALMLAAVLEGLTHVQTCADMQITVSFCRISSMREASQ